MKKIFLSIIIIFALCFRGYCQDVNLVVFQGDVHLNGSKNSLNERAIYKIEPNSSMTFLSNSNFMIYYKTKYLEKTSKMQQSETWSYNTILSKLKKEIPKTFIDYLNNYHQIFTVNEESVSGVPAGIKALNQNHGKIISSEYDAFPSDSCKIVASTIDLKWELGKNVNQISLVVTEKKTGEKIVDKIIDQSGSCTVSFIHDGWYDWEIKSKLENKHYISYSFLKLSSTEAKKELENFSKFKGSIAPLDEETKDFLIEDYLSQKGLILE